MERITAQFQFPLHAPREFRKHDMDGNYVRIQTIYSGAEDDIRLQTIKPPVPGTRKVVSEKPPHKIEEMRAGEFWYAMQGYLRKVEILHVLAIDVDLALIRQAREPFNDGALGAIALVEEWRNKRQPDFLAGHHLNCAFRQWCAEWNWKSP